MKVDDASVHDDSATNAIQVKYCSITRGSSSDYWDYYDEGPWGYWSEPVDCPDNQYIASMIALYEADSGDGSGLNGVSFMCKTLYNTKATGPFTL